MAAMGASRVRVRKQAGYGNGRLAEGVKTRGVMLQHRGAEGAEKTENETDKDSRYHSLRTTVPEI
jgi:hypothetical protein